MNDWVKSGMSGARFKLDTINLGSEERSKKQIRYLSPLSERPGNAQLRILLFSLFSQTSTTITVAAAESFVKLSQIMLRNIPAYYLPSLAGVKQLAI